MDGERVAAKRASDDIAQHSRKSLSRPEGHDEISAREVVIKVVSRGSEALEAVRVHIERGRLLDSPDWSGERALIYSSRTSNYLAAVRRNAAGMLDNIDLVHWMITSCNECVDVISEHEPIVGPLAST